MKIMQVTVEVARVEAASTEVLVLLHCEGEAKTGLKSTEQRLAISYRVRIS